MKIHLRLTTAKSGTKDLDLPRSFRFALARLQGRMRLQAAGVVFGKGLSAIGAPVAERHPESEIRLGDEVMLISRSFATALGVNHPVVLRTLAPGAAIRIGDRVGISGGSICAAGLVEIGDDTLLGANVTIADTDFHPLHARRGRMQSRHSGSDCAVRIGTNVFIGTNATVWKGVSIGDHAVIGAGSVVTRDVPAGCVAAGNPCRIVRMLSPDECEAEDAGFTSAPAYAAS